MIMYKKIEKDRRDDRKNYLSGVQNVLRVNNPSSEGPTLISPQRGGVYLKSSNGMMEWWNNGILGLKTGPPQAD